jgi:hypothetical protein
LGSVITGKTLSKNNPEDWGDEMPFDVSYLPILNSSSLFRSSISVWMLSWYRRGLVNRSPLPVISPDGRMKYQKPHVEQISPDKSMNFRYTTAAFTISPEPLGFVMLPACALHADRCQLTRKLGPFRLRSLSYGGAGVCLASRRPGVALAKTGFRRSLTIPPLPLANTFANILILTGFTYKGLSPYKFTPMPGVHQGLQRIAKSARPLMLNVEPVEKF